MFGPPTLSAYFFYTILGSLLAIIAGVGLIKNKQTIQLANPLPILFFGLLAIYYFFNGWVNGNGGINLRHYIILADAVLLISFCALLSKGQINLLAISKIITIITIIESLICILQNFSIIPSLDTLFKVTGSNVNPNVTAMFLAMAVPAVLLGLFQPSINPIRVSNPYRILSAISIILCLLALGFLQCRTAFIGATVSMVLILNRQYKLLHKLQTKFSKTALIIISIISKKATEYYLASLVIKNKFYNEPEMIKISLKFLACTMPEPLLLLKHTQNTSDGKPSSGTYSW